MHGKVMTVRHQAVNRRKDNRFAVALDSEQNNIHVKDIVKVIDGPHSVRTAEFIRPRLSIFISSSSEILQLTKCLLLDLHNDFKQKKGFISNFI